MTEKRLQKRRQCGPKTKSGCQTCKIRRVKCDETKPACQKCTSTGRKCDGYSKEIVITLPNDTQAKAVIQRIHAHVPGSSEEKRGLQYFVTHTAVELSGFYSSSFWEHLILQASAAEPSLRHVVIAIGALHEEFACGRLSYEPQFESKGQIFAYNQYTKAIGHLRRSLATGKQAPLTALMSCILFVCFDSIRGAFESALVHLQSGLKILRDVKAHSKEEEHIIQNSITPLFVRLCVQAILYIDTRSTPARRAFVTELSNIGLIDQETSIPECFENLEEARVSLEKSADGLFRMFYLCDGEVPFTLQPPEAVSMHFRSCSEISQWNNSFSKFMSIKTPTLSSKELRGAALLKIHHTIIKIMGAAAIHDVSGLRSLTEVANSPDTLINYTADFEIIVNLSKSLVAAAEQDVKNGKPALTFSADLGLVAPLYYVCSKCPGPQLRMKAMELLSRCPRREGMWDAEATRTMVGEFWEIEERHRILQEEVAENELGMQIPLTAYIDLEFSDGNKWKWIWKDPIHGDRSSQGGRSSGSTPSPGDEWMIRLQNQSLFGDEFYLMTEGSNGL